MGLSEGRVKQLQSCWATKSESIVPKMFLAEKGIKRFGLHVLPQCARRYYADPVEETERISWNCPFGNLRGNTRSGSSPPDSLVRWLVVSVAQRRDQTSACFIASNSYMQLRKVFRDGHGEKNIENTSLEFCRVILV